MAKRGRPRGSRSASSSRPRPSTSTSTTTPSQAETSGSNRTTSSKKRSRDEDQSGSQASKRLRSNEGPEVENAPALEPRVKRFSHKTIQKSWKILNEASRASISEIINSAIPVVLASVQVRSTDKREEAQEQLNKLVRAINRRMIKVLIPPRSKMPHAFDREKLMSANAQLEAQLIPDVEQAAHLKKQVQTEMRLLQEDEARLRHFEHASKAVEAKNRALQQGKLHPKLTEEPHSERVAIDDDFIKEHLNAETVSAEPYTDDADDELQQLVTNLRAHLSQIEKRTAPLDKVSQGIATADEQLLRLATELGIELDV